MNSKKAIPILKRQRDKIGNMNNPEKDAWVFQTASFIKDFFGQNSTEYNFISNYSFAVRVHSAIPNERKLEIIKEKKESVIHFLNNCVETIQDKGLYKPPKKNFISRINDTWLIVILTFGIPSIFGLGWWVGEYRSDLKNIELRQEIKDLTSIISSSGKDNISDQNSTQFPSNKSAHEEPKDSVHIK